MTVERIDEKLKILDEVSTLLAKSENPFEQMYSVLMAGNMFNLKVLRQILIDINK